MEPDRQVEIQLGHMCNNRCVFCVSGQRTAIGEALPLEAAPILESVRDAHAKGIRKITLLGGEPTLQPAFMQVVREAVRLRFDEIVVFTNGAKTARPEFVDEVLATCGRFTWRLSFQGATALAHERTTKKLGSFQRLVRTLENLRDRKQRITVNMCVVQSNYASVPAFPALLLPYGASQLHLDMMRPLDAGDRTEAELRATMPRYTEMVPALREMIAGFPDGFDVNIGNLPYCVAPDLAPWIHHDGETTFTIAVDHDRDLSEPWDKYDVKRRDKFKPSRCRSCVFEGRCSGIFETYARFYGEDELVPVDLNRLRSVDPKRRQFGVEMNARIERLREWNPPAPFRLRGSRIDERAGVAVFEFESDEGFEIEVDASTVAGGFAATDRFSLHLRRTSAGRSDVMPLLRALLQELTRHGDLDIVHPLGNDAVLPSIDPRIGTCVARMRARAPFGVLRWDDVVIDDDGRAAVARFAHPEGTNVSFRIAIAGGGVRGGYQLDRVPDSAPPASLVDGVRSVMDALAGRT